MNILKPSCLSSKLFRFGGMHQQNSQQCLPDPCPAEGAIGTFHHPTYFNILWCTINLLTYKRFRIMLCVSLPHEVMEIAVSETNGVSRINAVFLCAKPQFTITLDWVRQLKDWLGSFVPILQPYLVRHHDCSLVVGFITLQTEAAIMPNNHAQVSNKKNQLTKPVSENKPTISVSYYEEETIKQHKKIIDTSSNVFLSNPTEDHLDLLKADLIQFLSTLNSLQSTQTQNESVKKSLFNVIDDSKRVIAKGVGFSLAIFLKRQLSTPCLIKFDRMEVIA